MPTYTVTNPLFDNIEYDIVRQLSYGCHLAWRIRYDNCDGTKQETPRLYGSEEEATRNVDDDLAFTVHFWEKQLSDRERAVVAAGTHYRLGTSNAANRSHRGFGGRIWHFTDLVTHEVITSSDVWYQGVIPKFCAKAFPNTHKVSQA